MPVEAQSDSIEVIHSSSGQEWMWNEATAVYADCLTSAGIIGKVEFTHCLREVNEVAHQIARCCFDSKNSCNWVDEPLVLFRKLS
jgi:hypothetical protein